jgi:hypothetical protein
VLAAAWLVAVVAAVIALIPRVESEKQNRTVFVAMEYADIRDRSLVLGLQPGEYLDALKGAGLTGVALTEIKLQDLATQNRAVVMSAQEVEARNAAALFKGQPRLTETSFPPAHSLVMFQDQVEGAVVRDALVERLGLAKVTRITHPQLYVLDVDLKPEDLLVLTLGFDPVDIAVVSQSGLYVIPVVMNYAGITQSGVNRRLDAIRGLPLAGLSFGSNDILGDPSYITTTSAFINNMGIPAALLQSNAGLGYGVLRGRDELLAAIGERMVRVYRISRAETTNVGPADMIPRWLNSVNEYNTRVLYARPYYLRGPADPAAEVAYNQQYVTDLVSELRRQGYQIGNPQPFTPYVLTPFVQALIAMGFVAAGIYILNLVHKLPTVVNVGLALGSPLAYVGAWHVGPNLIRAVTATAGAIISATLPVAWLLNAPGLWDEHKRLRALRVFSYWSGSTALGIVGGSLLAAFLADTAYFNELQYFRGVKLLYVAPIILATIIAYFFSRTVRDRHERPVDVLNRFFTHHITVLDAVLVGILGLGALLYLLRSGNSATIPAWEEKLRWALEGLLKARPREKEFLIGYPALVVAISLAQAGWRRKLELLFAAGSIVGVSVVDTFAHLRTPYLLSLARCLYGAGLGLLFGLVALLVIIGLDTYIRRRW